MQTIIDKTKAVKANLAMPRTLIDQGHATIPIETANFLKSHAMSGKICLRLGIIPLVFVLCLHAFNVTTFMAFVNAGSKQ